MMLKFTISFLVTLGLGLLLSPCQAEVQLMHETLTVNIHNATMKEVLDDISHQADLTIVTFEETHIGNVRISKMFWNLPLEEGLDRLLRGWNYGVNRNASTGKITTLYLVSQRSDVSTLSWPHSTKIPSNPQDLDTSTQTSFPEESDNDKNFYGYTEDNESNEYPTESDFPTKTELDRLPPDLRKQLEKLYRNTQG